MSKILIAYFSQSAGNTKAAAEIAAALVGGDLFRIATVSPYPDDYHKIVNIAKNEKLEKFRPKLINKIPDMDDYSTIILAYPNWWGTIPMAVCSFLESYNFTGKSIWPLCTHEGSGLGQSEMDIQKLCSGANIKIGLAIRGSSVRSSRKAIATWLEQERRG